MSITLATIPACVAVTTIVKDMGLPTKLSPLISVLVGIGLSIFDTFTTVYDYGGNPNWFTAVGTGLVLGLSASGLYDGVKMLAKPNKGKHAKLDSGLENLTN